MHTAGARHGRDGDTHGCWGSSLLEGAIPQKNPRRGCISTAGSSAGHLDQGEPELLEEDFQEDPGDIQAGMGAWCHLPPWCSQP